VFTGHTTTRAQGVATSTKNQFRTAPSIAIASSVDGQATPGATFKTTQAAASHHSSIHKRNPHVVLKQPVLPYRKTISCRAEAIRHSLRKTISCTTAAISHAMRKTISCLAEATLHALARQSHAVLKQTVMPCARQSHAVLKQTVMPAQDNLMHDGSKLSCPRKTISCPAEVRYHVIARQSHARLPTTSCKEWQQCRTPSQALHANNHTRGHGSCRGSADPTVRGSLPSGFDPGWSHVAKTCLNATIVSVRP
jgi:hypothetical protein